MDAAYERLMSSAEIKALGEETRERLQEAGLDKLVADGTRFFCYSTDAAAAERCRTMMISPCGLYA